MNFLKIVRSHLKETGLGLLGLLSVAGVVLLVFKSANVSLEIAEFSAKSAPVTDISRLLGSIRELITLSSIVILILSSTLCFTLYYFIKRQRQLARAAAIIKKSQNRYRFFTEAPPSIGILRFDLVEVKVHDANRAALSLFGRPRSELVGKSLFSLLPESEISKMRHAVEELRAGRASLEVVLRFEDALDRERFISWHVTSLKNPDAEPEAIAVVLDVTDKMEAEKERIEKERLAGVLEMAGATAHELNQPLQVISGIAWMMLSKLKKDDPNYKNAEKICAEVERMSNIAGKISSISSYKVKNYVGETRIIDIEKAASPSKKSRFNGKAASSRVNNNKA